jgi:DNA repair protein RadD
MKMYLSTLISDRGARNDPASLSRKLNNDIEAEFDAGHRRVIGVLPTGGGKTVNASALAKKWSDLMRSVVFIGHTNEIILQTSRKLHQHDVSHGVIKAGLDKLARPQSLVQVASIQTLHARCIRSSKRPLPHADLVIVDETHHILASTYRKLIDQITEMYPQARVLGLTATPCRGDGRGLGGMFDAMVEGPQVHELIALGFLVGTKFFAPPEEEMKRLVRGVATVGADYNQKQLGARLDHVALIGDIVGQYTKHGEERKFLTYATTVQHSLHIAERFNELGISVEHIDAKTPKEDRDAILSRLASGETRGVTNVGILTEGFDCPDVGCIILARPTKSFGLYRQMCGRGLRSAPGKSDVIILDHSGAVYRHGLPEDHIEWSLDPDTKAEAKAHTSAASNFESAKRFVECSQCSAIRKGGEACPHCGFLPKRRSEAFACHDGELGRFEGGTSQMTIYTPEERHEWHGMLAHIARERGYKSGWVAHKFKEKFGTWPLQRYVEYIKPTPEVLSWVRSRMIAFAKGQEKNRIAS